MQFPESEDLPEESPRPVGKPTEGIIDLSARPTKAYRPKKVERKRFSLFKPKAVSPSQAGSKPQEGEPKAKWKGFTFFKRKAAPSAPADLPPSPAPPSVPQAEPRVPRVVRPPSPAGSTPRPVAPTRPEGRGLPSSRGREKSPPLPEREFGPGKRLSAFEVAGRNAPPPKLPLRYRLRQRGQAVRRAAWDISSILSLLINAVLVAVLLILGRQIQVLKNTVNGLMGGLYDNFVRMDQSVIEYDMPVDYIEIPLDFTVDVVQPETYVVLTRDVVIPNARVTINAGILTIRDAQAIVTLPGGSALPVSLNMGIHVQKTVTSHFTVPVRIPLAQASPPPPAASLHEAFTGLQDTIGPLTCLLNPDAQDYLGTLLCNQGVYVFHSSRP